MLKSSLIVERSRPLRLLTSIERGLQGILGGENNLGLEIVTVTKALATLHRSLTLTTPSPRRTGNCWLRSLLTHRVPPKLLVYRRKTFSSFLEGTNFLLAKSHRLYSMEPHISVTSVRNQDVTHILRTLGGSELFILRRRTPSSRSSILCKSSLLINPCHGLSGSSSSRINMSTLKSFSPLLTLGTIIMMMPRTLGMATFWSRRTLLLPRNPFEGKQIGRESLMHGVMGPLSFTLTVAKSCRDMRRLYEISFALLLLTLTTLSGLTLKAGNVMQTHPTVLTTGRSQWFPFYPNCFVAPNGWAIMWQVLAWVKSKP